MKASCKGHVGCVELLLDKGAEVDLQDEVSTVTQLIIACLTSFLVYKWIQQVTFHLNKQSCVSHYTLYMCMSAVML